MVDQFDPADLSSDHHTRSSRPTTTPTPHQNHPLLLLQSFTMPPKCFAVPIFALALHSYRSLDSDTYCFGFSMTLCTCFLVIIADPSDDEESRKLQFYFPLISANLRDIFFASNSEVTDLLVVTSLLFLTSSWVFQYPDYYRGVDARATIYLSWLWLSMYILEQKPGWPLSCTPSAL